MIPFLVLIVTGVIVLATNGILGDILKNMFTYGISPNYRDTLFETAIEQYKLHTFFGAGIYTTNYYLNGIWNYHNYIFQMIGTCGALGLICFISYVYYSIKQSLNWRTYSVFNLIIITYFLIHGLVDNLYFHHLIMPILCVIQALEHQKKKINLFEIQYREDLTNVKFRVELDSLKVSLLFWTGLIYNKEVY